MSTPKVKTLKELSELTGFTQSTVSRVLNGKGTQYRISGTSQDIIKKAAEANNFSFNENARGLRLKKTNTIGLIVPDISNPFFAIIASLIEKQARSHRYSTFLCNSDNSTEVEKSSVTLLQNRKVDGIIVFPVGIESEHLLDFHKTSPLILIDRYFKNTDIPYITSDDYGGAYKAVKHLIDLGHKKIIAVQGLEDTSQNDNRLKAYKDAIISSKLNFDKELIIGNDFSEENGYLSAKKIINWQADEKPTAIFSLSNIITLGILKAFSESNLSIPEDISLISFDEQNYSSLLSPPMTTISQPKEEMGKLAFEMLLKQIESDTKLKQEHITLPTSLIIRKSTKSLL